MQEEIEKKSKKGKKLERSQEGKKGNARRSLSMGLSYCFLLFYRVACLLVRGFACFAL